MTDPADPAADPTAGPPVGPVAERAPEHVQSLARGLAVIRAFGADAPELTLSEVARASGLTRAAARRFLLTLVDVGYVRTDGRLFALSPRVLELGYAYLSGLTLPEVAQPHLERLVAEVHESASVAVLDADEVVYVARVATSRIMRVAINIGTRFPAHCTSMGRVLLAWLPGLAERLAGMELHGPTSRTITSPGALAAELASVREQGWALVDQELEEGLRSIAAPIRNRAGTVVAAVNLSTHASRTSVAAAQRALLPPLLATAGRIEADLHATGAMASRLTAP
ncbi:IclR family transcriptional regulator C-terminal domain-containing protein [Spongiactinospora sp. 9N601]|uniref:IclR family transcriptional regulator domain-containing protein n=1 Tax=Spongiactinospora sp. 9N601 TaxID=3375149 RepID=UPI003796FD9E